MHEPWHKLIPPAAGFLGAAAMMSYIGQMPTRLWVIALTSGPAIAYLATDIVVEYLTATYTWLPTSELGLLKLSGFVGAVLGLMAIHLVGALATFGKRFADNPPDFRSPK